ncbi:MAG: hypothetical protein NTW87_05250 [Planctomycetota bacterium]|nr:hypothetical protein [Planctomycetota bacterium]
MRTQGGHNGGEPQKGRPARQGKTADKPNVSVEHERKAAAMKKAIETEKQEPLKAEVRTVPESHGAQELFAPQEWDSLLTGIEQDGAPAKPATAHPFDLWEQLSRTGWLRKRPADGPPGGKTAQRPSA